MYYIVGSGPAGVAAAIPLVEAGLAVTILDSGLQLEDSVKQKVADLRQYSPEHWSTSDRAFLRGKAALVNGKLPRKTVFGSDFSYRQLPQFLVQGDAFNQSESSFAAGGFSTTWGAGLLSYSAADTSDWPLHLTELYPYYQAVQRWIPLAADRDALEKQHPLFSDSFSSLTRGRHISAWLQSIAGRRRSLEQAGFTYGAGRLALSDCRYCGLCLSGCPYDFIYRSSHTLALLRQRSPQLSYRRGLEVQEIREEAGSVAILTRDLNSQETIVFHGKRVFLAAGVLSSAKILLHSQRCYGEEVEIKDSQYFVFPLLTRVRCKSPRQEETFTIAQQVLHIAHPTLASPEIRLSLYPYNDFLSLTVQQKLGALYPLFRPFEDYFLGHLLLAQGCLPSKVSGSIRLSLEKQPSDGSLSLHCRSRLNPTSTIVFKKLFRHLLKNTSNLQALALAPLLQRGKIGQGFHMGASWPMALNPQGKFSSDLLGRPQGWQRLHLVDASVLPSLASGSITFTIMANAYRIAEQSRNLA